MTFSISRHELNRRIKAFTALSLTWLLVQLFITVTLPPEPQLISGVYTASMALVLLVIWLAVAYFFCNRYGRTRVVVSADKIERVTPKTTYTYPLTDVTAVHTVMTTRGLIRQISFVTSQGNRFNFDGLTRFEQFRQQIQRNCPDATYRITTEPLDYDHVLFYPVLGVLLGLFAIGLVLATYSSKWLVGFLGPAILLFSVAVGAFFAAIKPVARQYGKNAVVIDYLIAAALFVVALALIVV